MQYGDGHDIFAAHAQVAVSALQCVLDAHLRSLSIQSFHLLGQVFVHVLIAISASTAPEGLHGALIFASSAHREVHARRFCLARIQQSHAFLIAVKGPRGHLAAERTVILVLSGWCLVDVFLPFGSLLLL